MEIDSIDSRWWLLSTTYYGTWLPGDDRGSVTSVRDLRPDDPESPFRFEHDMPGEPWEGPIEGLARWAKEHMKGPPIFFDLAKAEIVLNQFLETAEYRGRVIHAIDIMYNHLHIIVEVFDDPDPDRMLADFKAYGSRSLNKQYGKPPSETWWTQRGSCRKLQDARHRANALEYVLYKQPNPLLVWSREKGRLV